MSLKLIALFCLEFSSPLSCVAEERVVGRSLDRVSYRRHANSTRCLNAIRLLTPTTLRWSTFSSLRGKRIDPYASIV